MKYFNNPKTGEVHAYDDDAPAHYILDWLTPMSDAEIEAYIASAGAPVSPNEGDERKWRDSELVAVMWLRERHRDQLEIEVQTTLTAEQFKELLLYMQALRDWPQSPDFPQVERRPVAPPWVAEQSE
ncbi:MULTISPECIES: phage tail assembly chaperone [Pseudomonas]|uniref:phage tail assembly chaperone n=1 Tax=Pseudomonas TaxID=286 RepID=UPI0013726EC0|nr:MULTISPECIES: phage tail assembly chaperone [Pseudomonas]MDT9642560.1 hypothetical protein [Pseudomonas sp. JV245A]NAN55275.1 hypothetical protein [Pseudomonas protegens]NUE77298.1 hypothetical protein [Pseudomonas protegens]